MYSAGIGPRWSGGVVQAANVPSGFSVAPVVHPLSWVAVQAASGRVVSVTPGLSKQTSNRLDMARRPNGPVARRSGRQ
jgi:hypothetical protein